MRKKAIRTGLVAALLLPAMLALGPAAPAHAYTCSRWYYENVDSGVSRLSLWFSPRCSDGRSHISGTIYDTSCDARQAKAYMVVQERRSGNPWWVVVWSVGVNVDNGCGTSSTFYKSGPAPTHDWRLVSATWAANFWGSSDMDQDILYP